MNLEVVQADYSNSQHARDIPWLLNQYATDPMGGGKALAEEVCAALVSELASRSYAFTVLAYLDGAPAGLVNCFEAFSTFAGKPLVNIHDVVVLSPFRGQGISLKMLEEVERIARQKGCCKLTLEVLSNNVVAKSAYNKFGFGGYELNPEAGTAEFWQKNLCFADPNSGQAEI